MAQGEATGTFHVAWRGTWLQKSPCQKSVNSDPLYRSGGPQGFAYAAAASKPEVCENECSERRASAGSPGAQRG